MTRRTSTLARTLRALIGGLALALPCAAQPRDLGQAAQQWMTAPAKDTVLFQDLLAMSDADAVLERLVGLPEDEQFAYAVSLLQVLPPSEHAKLITTVRQRIDASDNQAAKMRMNLLAGERMAGSPVEALAFIDATVQMAAAEEDLEAMTYALTRRAYMLLAAGDARAAATSFGMVAELCERRGLTDFQVGAQLLQAHQLVQLGDLTKAGDIVRAAKTNARQVRTRRPAGQRPPPPRASSRSRGRTTTRPCVTRPPPVATSRSCRRPATPAGSWASTSSPARPTARWATTRPRSRAGNA